MEVSSFYLSLLSLNVRNKENTVFQTDYLKIIAQKDEKINELLSFEEKCK